MCRHTISTGSRLTIWPNRCTVPAGTKVVYTQTYDNSSQNKANPDPDREITWGEQTWDEMIFGVIRYAT